MNIFLKKKASPARLASRLSEQSFTCIHLRTEEVQQVEIIGYKKRAIDYTVKESEPKCSKN